MDDEHVLELPETVQASLWALGLHLAIAETPRGQPITPDKVAESIGRAYGVLASAVQLLRDAPVPMVDSDGEVRYLTIRGFQLVSLAERPDPPPDGVIPFRRT